MYFEILPLYLSIVLMTRSLILLHTSVGSIPNCVSIYSHNANSPLKVIIIMFTCKEGQTHTQNTMCMYRK